MKYTTNRTYYPISHLSHGNMKITHYYKDNYNKQAYYLLKLGIFSEIFI
jgi:hypothetical protein